MYAYNPRKKTYEQLESQMVGEDRWEILNAVLSEMEIKKGEGPKQHWIVVGPRGIGKSHLMTLLYHKIKNKKVLKDKWIAVLFPEELRRVSSLYGFLERALREVLNEMEGVDKESPVVKTLREKMDEVRKTPQKERADNFFSLISWFYEETGKHIVLITENLQYLLGKKLSVIEQKKIRAFLQTSDSLLIIGTATTVFEGLHDHSHPFYHFFHVRRLEELSFEDMKIMISGILARRGKLESAEEFIDKDVRLRALYSFTGGNPRMAIFLADILSTELPEEMLDIMDMILDELTPYFDAIMSKIPDYQEEIINVLAEFEPAQSPAEIAAHLEMSQNTVRKYLKLLKDDGYIRIVFSQGKSNYYCLNEYLYRIWYQMRDSSHREETRWLMELLLILYSKDILHNERQRLVAIPNKEQSFISYKKLIHQTIDFSDTHPDFCKIIDYCVNSFEELKTAMELEEAKLSTEAVKYFEKEDFKGAADIAQKIISINPESKFGIFILVVSFLSIGRIADTIPFFEKLLIMYPDSYQLLVLFLKTLLSLNREEEAITILEKVNSKKSEGLFWKLTIADCYLMANLPEKSVLQLLNSITPYFLFLGNLSRNIFEFYVSNLLKQLNPEKYLSQLYAVEKREYSATVLNILLIFLGKLDVVETQIQELSKEFQHKEGEPGEEFDLLISAVKLFIGYNLLTGKMPEVEKLSHIFLLYVETVGILDDKQEEIISFCLDLLTFQLIQGIDPGHTKRILEMSGRVDFIVHDLIMEVWTCLNYPEAIEAKKYMSDKAIAKLVGVIKRAAGALKEDNV